MVSVNAVAGDYKVKNILSNTFEATIESIFSLSLNMLAFQGTFKKLITIIDKNYGAIPLGITIDPGKNFNFKDLKIKPGIKVKFNSGRILISNKLAINTQNCFWHKPRLIKSYLKNIDLAKTNLEIVNKILNESVSDYGLVPLIKHQNKIIENKIGEQLSFNSICQKAAVELGLFFSAYKYRQFESATNNISGLVGLGFGTTPSGDDIILGIITSFNYFYNSYKDIEIKKDFDSFLDKIRKKISGKTTLISEKYLIEATYGNISEKLAAFMDSILFNEETGLIIRSTKDLMSVGASSGKEIVLGSLMGLKFCVNTLKDERRVR